MEAKPQLLDQVRAKLRTRHYRYRTEQQYITWIRRFILHQRKLPPSLDRKYPYAHEEWSWQYVFSCLETITRSAIG